MNASALRCVLRHAKALTGDLPAQRDAELLRLFAEVGDEAAFAALVSRHGPMVWGVCRNLLSDADADDAFQATFLTFIRSARSIRKTDSLAGWLHRVAYRVALKARRSTQRREAREQAAAAADRAEIVPDSAWDQLMAAVHEEVNRLPDSARIPFVLCCLEGRRVTDAAAALKISVGTLSSRLTRAKQRVLDRLARRGLPVAAVAGSMALATATSSASVPAVLLEKTVGLSGTTSSIPSSIVNLTLGVMEINMSRTKLIGAVILVSGMLLAAVGPAVVPWASAQPAPKGAPGADTRDPVTGQLRSPASKWEFAYIEAPRPLSQRAFEEVCQSMEPEGWEYCGTQEMTLDRAANAKGAKRGPETVLVFKRPARQNLTRAEVGLPSAGGGEGKAMGRIEALEREIARLIAVEQALRDRAVQAEIEARARADRQAADRALRDSYQKADKGARTDQPANSGSSAANPASYGKGPFTPARDGQPPAAGQPEHAAGKRNPETNYNKEVNSYFSELQKAARGSATIEIMPLEDANAEEIAKILTEVFANQGTFQADKRSNSLVIKADAKTLDEVRVLLERLAKQADMKRARDRARWENALRKQ
jgi:RNA polymerase sigma factor (sigma-70 family)